MEKIVEKNKIFNKNNVLDYLERIIYAEKEDLDDLMGEEYHSHKFLINIVLKTIYDDLREMVEMESENKEICLAMMYINNYLEVTEKWINHFIKEISKGLERDIEVTMSLHYFANEMRKKMKGESKVEVI